MKIKNWKKFQHYQNRKPPWIKLYKDILDQRDINMLADCSFRILIELWILASEDPQNEGNLPEIPDIAFRLRRTEKEIVKSLQELKEFIIFNDSKMLASCNQSAMLETETETETEKRESMRGNKMASPTPSELTTQFIDSLKSNPAYKHINLEAELGKMDAWLSSRPGRKKTRRFVVNWLNKIEIPLEPQKSANPWDYAEDFNKTYAENK